MFSLLDMYLLLHFGPVKTAKYSLFYSQETSSYLCSMVQPPSCTTPICNTCLYLVLCRNFFLHTSIQYDYIYHALIMVCFLCRNFFLHTGAKQDYILHVLSYHMFYRNIIGILFQIFYLPTQTCMTSIYQRYFSVCLYTKQKIIPQFHLGTAHNFSYDNFIKPFSFTSSSDLSTITVGFTFSFQSGY